MLTLLLVTCLTAAQPPGDEALKAQVDELVVKLDEDTIAIREKAEKDLISLGPCALDYLPPPGSPQFNDAIKRIRKTLEQAQAQTSIQASLVTLKGHLKLSKILAEIQTQTGNKLSAPPQPEVGQAVDPEIDVDFDKSPFWAALDAVLDRAQLSIYPYGQPGALQLVPRGPRALPRVGRAAIIGPLRIEPVRVNAVRDLRSATPASLQISLEIAWEPRLQPIAIKLPAADLNAVDSSGAALAPDNPEAENEAPLSRQGVSATEMNVSLVMPAAGVKEIASLNGSLEVIMLGRVETFKFDNLLRIKQKQKKRIAAATVELSEVRKNGDSWEINVLLSYDRAGDALESHRNWALQNKAYLESDAKPIEPDSMETTSRTPKSIGVGYVFALKGKSPEKMTFVYQTPGLIATKDFGFELKGIKLP